MSSDGASITIQDLSRSPTWAQMKKSRAVEIKVRGRTWNVELVEVPTLFGFMRYFICPRCGGRRRALQVVGDELICSRCRGHRKEVPGSAWGREILRPARQLARVEARLARPGPDREGRRRLRRRRERLLHRLEAGLAVRRERLEGLLSVLESAAPRR